MKYLFRVCVDDLLAHKSDNFRRHDCTPDSLCLFDYKMYTWFLPDVKDKTEFPLLQWSVRN